MLQEKFKVCSISVVQGLIHIHPNKDDNNKIVLENAIIDYDENIVTIKGDERRNTYFMYTETNPKIIAKYNDEDVQYKRKYGLFGEKIPYLKGWATKKELTPYQLRTNVYCITYHNIV